MYNRNMRAVAALLLISVSACGVGTGPKSSDRPWTKLPDGSWLSHPVSDKEGKWHTVTRCWGAGSKFDCLRVFDYQGDIEARRFQTIKLSDDDQDVDGYACLSSDQQYIESINKHFSGPSAQTLISNTFGKNSDQFWPRAYVEDYMTKNGVDPASYFDCSFVMHLLKVGSYMSLSTTDVTHEWLTGPRPAGNPKILGDNAATP